MEIAEKIILRAEAKAANVRRYGIPRAEERLANLNALADTLEANARAARTGDLRALELLIEKGIE